MSMEGTKDRITRKYASTVAEMHADDKCYIIHIISVALEGKKHALARVFHNHGCQRKKPVTMKTG